MNLRVAAGWNPSLLFEDPIEVWAPATMQGACDALARAENALAQGYWIAGALTYEFGARLAGVETHEPQLPMLVLGAFREPERRNSGSAGNAFRMAAPLSRIGRGDYAAQIERILNAIRDGEVYQVNYTVPFDVAFEGNREALFAVLAERARAPYSAFLECDDVSLVSISPELFLHFDGARITTKPMKGTAPLDATQALGNEKNRAEHVMIVDLLRNDLHRICDDVRVERLFEVERYPTFATMTSTISGQLSRPATLEAIFRATFPCGSVTGAPKRAAMQYITAAEREARGFYTGTIGFLSPERRGWWNVPIRTLQFTRGAACGRVDVGGGIVSDSGAEDEWDEVLLKARFLEPAYGDFALLETLRGGEEPSDIDAHLDRLMRSADAFGMNIDRENAAQQLRGACDSPEPRLVRLRAGRGGLTVESQPLALTPTPVAVGISALRVNSADPLLAHKSVWRPVHEAASAEARARGCFDVILSNERGELTEGARTNIFVEIGNTLYTPPLTCGVLPGILRSRLVSEGRAVERILVERDLSAASALYIGNSARGLMQARLQR